MQYRLLGVGGSLRNPSALCGSLLGLASCCKDQEGGNFGAGELERLGMMHPGMLEDSKLVVLCRWNALKFV